MKYTQEVPDDAPDLVCVLYKRGQKQRTFKAFGTTFSRPTADQQCHDLAQKEIAQGDEPSVYRVVNYRRGDEYPQTMSV